MAVNALMATGDIMNRLINKIRQQWRTVNKAFKDFNEDNDEFIQKDELIFFLTHWGFPLPEAEQDLVFNYFDKDGDGQISYQDFVQSIGYEIHPSETLYFRQEMPGIVKQMNSACDEAGCWVNSIGRTLFCTPHLKQNHQKVLRLYRNIYKKVTLANPEKWAQLVTQMEHNGMRDDRSLIKIQDFERVLSKFKLKLQGRQRNLI